MRPPHDASPGPTGSLPTTLTRLVERFEEAWQQAPPAPGLDDFLPPDGALRRRAVVELAHVDLEWRLKAGQAARVEDYLRRFPELAGDDSAVSDLIAAEHRLRVRSEPDLGATEYLERFPRQRQVILARLPSAAEPAATLHTAPPAAAPSTRLSLPPDTGAPSAAAPPVAAPAGRYELGEEIGHGGMGAVLRARDPQLGRELAVKVLKRDGHAHPEQLRRFVEEAQVCSQLQHPAIVPVHDFGTLPDGRPFIAMKLVKGRTLAALLKERPSPAEDLPRFLGIFEQVCQAVGYAHSKGVIHRDLKPANVMVGNFGEVQVMDWGLAKVLRPQNCGAPAGEETAASVVRTVRSAAGDESRAGQAMGTPAYMAPEQARGEVELLDERADVFGLGAILCEVLTGRPPFTGRSANEVHAQAMCADLGDAFARLDGCGADAELVRLAKACLAAKAEGRPRDGGAVAQAVTAYQRSVQERLRQADLERAAEQARAATAQAKARAERRARRLTAGLAAVVLTLVVALAAGGLWLQRQREERRQEEARQEGALRQDMGSRLEQAARFRQGGHFEDALALLGPARERLGAGGPDDLRQAVKRAWDDTTLLKRFDDARQRADTLVEGEFDYAGAREEYAAAWRAAGLGGEGEGAEVVGARVRASAVREELVAALDAWASLTKDEPRREWLLAVAQAADPDPLRVRLRQPALWRDKATLAREATARVAKLPPHLAAASGRVLDLSGGDAISLLREAQALHPADFWLHYYLGLALWRANEFGDAIGHYRAALALRPHAPAVHYRLGVVLLEHGKLDEASRHAEEALRLDPSFIYAHDTLGRILKKKGKLEDAIGHFEEALRLAPKAAPAHVNLGLALYKQGKVGEATRHYEEALRIDPKCAPAHNSLGIALHKQGQVDEAMRHYEEALRIDPKYHPAHVNLGFALKTQGKVGEAIRHYEEGLRIDPRCVEAHANLAEAMKVKGRLDETIRHYEEAVRLDPKSRRPTTASASPCRSRAGWRRRSATSRRQSASTPSTPNPMSTSASH